MRIIHSIQFRNGVLIKLFLICVAFFLSSAFVSYDAKYPTIRFVYSFVPFDRACSEQAAYDIKQEWVEEMEGRVGFFQEYWDREGPRLLETIISEIGKPFQQREMIATITLCNFPSMSQPLLINLRRYLATATDNNPRPMYKFIGLVTHELLHTYVNDHLVNSELLKKYEKETFSVQNHLHLMAVLKMAYLKSDCERELNEVIKLDCEIGPIYARAWEIVNDIEGYEPFVNELKK